MVKSVSKRICLSISKIPGKKFTDLVCRKTRTQRDRANWDNTDSDLS